jgi:hypothetical protein
LPGLIAASVWMRSRSPALLVSRYRLSALMMPWSTTVKTEGIADRETD